MDEAALYADFRAHGIETLDVLVNGPHTEIAAAGHSYRCFAETAQQCADEIVGGTETAA